MIIKFAWDTWVKKKRTKDEMKGKKNSGQVCSVEMTASTVYVVRR